MGPLTGTRVVEVSLGVSVVGAGLAISLPGSIMRDFGAEVVRVQSARRSTLDQGVEFARAWDRGKEVVDVDDSDAAAATVAAQVRDADMVFLAGPEELIERAGLQYPRLARSNPRLIAVRIRPSSNALGGMPDLELLVQARAGVPTQIRAHRAGPAFGDLAVGSAGAGLSAAAGGLAGLYERERTGAGGWAETSLYDGIQAILPMIGGRVEHHSPSTTMLWKNQGPAEALCYRCADGGYVQIWFGAKGAYEEFLEHMGEPPSEAGYNADTRSGVMVERGKRWAEKFAARERDWWIADLAGRNFRCEPAWRPGEALRDPHLREIGLSVDLSGAGGPITVLGPVVTVTPVASSGAAGWPSGPAGQARERGPLSDVRVLDLSAYLAGPVGPLILAELGADVVKVEPLTGDVHRTMEPMFAAGQRGKRAVALNLKSAGAPAVLSRLFGWADVVHHNSRVGLAERLGYDEARVRAVNPDVIYSFASGFGEHGPRALLPANDQLMQALAGIEAAQGGVGQPPTFLIWGAVDVTGGWISACGMLAALYARRRGGGGQSVASSLLGAAMTLKSGAFLAGGPVVSGTVVSGTVVSGTVVSGTVVSGTVVSGTVVSGPVLDARQTGYGAAYRIYQGADAQWFALAVPDAATWARLCEVVPGEDLPAFPPPLRTEPAGPQPEELVLEAVFRSKNAAAWLRELHAAGVPVEPVGEVDRTEFAARFLDDPVNREMGRVVTHHWGDRGRVEQPRFPPRLGPAPQPGARAGIPGLGEHTTEMLASLGFDPEQRRVLAASGTVPMPPGGLDTCQRAADAQRSSN
jgi:crotonobetainyl-CoA:carnitine CoA-transferase CaiB-like acyl-CoA transferase